MASTHEQARTDTPTTYTDAPTQRVTAANGIEHAYRDVGDGDVPLLLLQHFRGNLDNWDPALIDALASDRRVVTFDNVGVAATTGTTPNTVGAMAHGADDLWRPAVHPRCALWCGGGEHDAPQHVGTDERDLLCDEAAKREAEQIDSLKTQVATAIRAAPPPAPPPRPVDLLLDGLGLLITDGHAAGTPVLRRAVSAFHDHEIGTEESLR